jgi:hypothetical protein
MEDNSTTDANEMDAKYDRIREVLQSQCSEEEFRQLRCPQCGGEVTLRLNHDGRRFFVRCIADNSHLAMHGKNETPPQWFERMPHTGWYGASAE